MKKELFREVEIPEGIEAELEGHMLRLKGPAGENHRNFKLHNLDFKMEGNKFIIGNKKSTKREKKLMNVVASHIKNMIKGVEKRYEYDLKVCFSHFPITVEMKGKEVLIKNFLGEKIPRKMTIPGGVEVDINKDVIKVKSTSKELAGQVAANFETVTKIRNRDKRVFQDGIFITSKAGRHM